MEFEKLKKICMSFGARAVSIISTEELEFNETYRQFCVDNICGSYGRNYACPPFSGTPEELEKKAKKHPYALVFQNVTAIVEGEEPYYYEKAKLENNTIGDNVREELRKAGYSYLQARASECNLCEKCGAVTNEPCRNPDKAAVSLSAYCVDVSKMARVCQMNYNNGSDTVTYFGIIFFSPK